MVAASVVAGLASMIAQASNPIPGHYQEPGLSPNRAYVNQHVTERIDPFTGKLQVHSVDLFLPGNGGLDLQVQRSYSSVDEFLSEPNDSNLMVPNAVGVGWSMHFGRVLRRRPLDLCASNFSSTNTPVVELPDGHRHLMYLMAPELREAAGLPNDRDHWISTSRWRAQCAANGIGMWVFAPDGTRYEMTTPGLSFGNAVTPTQAWYTTRIVDRNDNRLEFEYVNVGAATSVRRVVGYNSGGMPDGREVQFQYVGNALDSVTDGMRTWRYRHVYSLSALGGENYPFLARVERPDGQSWQYEYNLDKAVDVAGAYSMKRLMYPTGGAFTYDYGFVNFSRASSRKSTVVSRKVASDQLDGLAGMPGNAWEFIYNPAQRPCELVVDACTFVGGSYDQTIIKAPDTTYEYRHVGANSAWGGMIWAVGQLLSKRVDGSEATGWYEIEQPLIEAQKISNSFIFRPGLSAGDSAVFAPIQTGTQTLRNGALYQSQMSGHDALGNPAVVTESGPNGTGGEVSRTTNVSYYINPELWIIRLPTLERISGVGDVLREYNVRGNLLSENRYGVITRWTYTPQGDVETRTDARLNKVAYSNYYRGVPQREEHPESVVIQRLVSHAGNVVAETDGEGRTVRYDHDGLNRVVSIDHPLASSNDVSVGWEGNRRVVTRGAYVETTVFDAYGRVASVTHQDKVSGQTVAQTYAHDVYGRQRFASYPNDTVGTRTQYDVLGRPSLVEHATLPTGMPIATVSHRYVAYTTQTTNERGAVFTYVYRGFGRPNAQELLQVITPDGVSNASLSITRNVLGQPLTVTQDGKTRRFEYDTKYFLWKQTDPETGTTEFGRDEVGNMTWRKVGAAGRTDFEYDGRNRLKVTRYQASTGIAAAPTVTQAYFRDDKVKSVETATATRSFEYDTNKNLISETLALPGRPALVVRYGHDGNDALASITYGSGARVDYAPNAFGRPTQAAPYVTSIEHFASGAIKRMVYANGVTTDMAQNARLWPESIRATTAMGDVTRLGYRYDALGNVSQITDSVIPGNNWRLEYDAMDRLAGISGGGAVGGGVSFDGRGNLRVKAVGLSTATYTYDASSDLLTEVEGTRYVQISTGLTPLPFSYTLSYDALGNMTRRGTTTFQFNAAQQMVCAHCATPKEVRYGHDGLGMRVSTTKGTDATLFVYGAVGNLLWEVMPSGELKEYFYVTGKQVALRRVRP